MVRLVIGGLRGFEWDAANWRKSELKHGIAAAEAEEVVLNNPLSQVDSRHSDTEQRYVALGATNDGRSLFVAFTMRIIPARPMSRKERRIYETAKGKERS